MLSNFLVQYKKTASISQRIKVEIYLKDGIVIRQLLVSLSIYIQIIKSCQSIYNPVRLYSLACRRKRWTSELYKNLKQNAIVNKLNHMSK